MRLNPNLMPIVHLSHKDKGYGFDVLADKYLAMDKQPLLIEALLTTPYVPVGSDNSVHFDGLLSQAVLTAHPCAPQFNGQACIVPLPLDILWLSPKGLPLWAASDMLPDEQVSSREYWHKRYPSHRADFGQKLAAVTTAGRWKEYRVPINAIRANRLHAIVIGNKSEIDRLLTFVSHIGKKSAAGYGRVSAWTTTVLDAVDPIEMVLSAKAAPVEYAEQKQLIGKYNPLKGWTPPYWYAPYHSACISCQP